MSIHDHALVDERCMTAYFMARGREALVMELVHVSDFEENMTWKMNSARVKLIQLGMVITRKEYRKELFQRYDY